MQSYEFFAPTTFYQRDAAEILATVIMSYPTIPNPLHHSLRELHWISSHAACPRNGSFQQLSACKWRQLQDGLQPGKAQIRYAYLEQMLSPIQWFVCFLRMCLQALTAGWCKHVLAILRSLNYWFRPWFFRHSSR